jgi:hypothetical protein
LMKAHQSKSGAGGRAGSIADYSSQLGLVARELSRGDETATALRGRQRDILCLFSKIRRTVNDWCRFADVGAKQTMGSSGVDRHHLA